MVKMAGKDAQVGGNIGLGVLGLEEMHAGAVYVLELSSYQLDLTSSLKPDAAVLLNITPDHLDRHGGMDGYVAAKRRIHPVQHGARPGFFHAVARLGLRDHDVLFAPGHLRRALPKQRRHCA